MISAVVLVHNEEKNIRQCLLSVAWCEEIIVVDDHSTDGTLREIRGIGEIKEKAKIYQRNLNGDFAAQRNFGLNKAKGEWVLFVDPDEEVSPELEAEIKRKAGAEDFLGYYLRRTDYFWGRKLSHGETANVRLMRLAKRRCGIWKRAVHESWDIAGQTTVLNNYLKHNPHPTIREFIDSLNFYTEIDARQLPKEGKEFSFFRLIANPSGKFLQNYFLRFGFLDGLSGLVVAFMMSLHSLVVRVKMYDFSKTS